MQGKRGLILGLAHDRSVVWGIAEKLWEQGAELEVEEPEPDETERKEEGGVEV